jgi:hypothetical protein
MINVGAFLLLSLLSSSANRGDHLQVVQNERLAYVLANLQVLSETSPQQSKALRVRVLSVPEQGECDGTPQSCPQVELFIAVSGFDEYPDQRVYQLPRRYDWRFIEWGRFPDEDGPTDYVEFTLEADDPIPQPADTWWRTTRYRLKVNYHDGTMTEQRAG